MNFKKMEEEEEKIEETKILNTFLGKKINSETKKNWSSSSNSFGFQIDEQKNDIIIEYKHICEHSEFDKYIAKINSPCSYKITNPELLEKFCESKEKNREIKLSKSFFEDLDQNDINAIDLNYITKENYKDKGAKILYFSSSLLKTNDNNDNKLFEKLHNYLTDYSDKSLISDFCFDKDLYFPFAGNDYYLGYDRLYSRILIKIYIKI